MFSWKQYHTNVPVLPKTRLIIMLSLLLLFAALPLVEDVHWTRVSLPVFLGLVLPWPLRNWIVADPARTLLFLRVLGVGFPLFPLFMDKHMALTLCGLSAAIWVSVWFRLHGDSEVVVRD